MAEVVKSRKINICHWCESAAHTVKYSDGSYFCSNCVKGNVVSDNANLKIMSNMLYDIENDQAPYKDDPSKAVKAIAYVLGEIVDKIKYGDEWDTDDHHDEDDY